MELRFFSLSFCSSLLSGAVARFQQGDRLQALAARVDPNEDIGRRAPLAGRRLSSLFSNLGDSISKRASRKR